MLPNQCLAQAKTPGGQALTLTQHGDDFYIHIDREELMSSRAFWSEKALSGLAIDQLADRPAPRILIGGLGMSYTLRAALDALGDRPAARVIVAELVPEVIEWNRTVLAHLTERPLEDPRVEVIEGDVAHVVAGADEPYDAILLDVDNGPHALCIDSNHKLYSRRGLRHLALALTPGGVFGLWAAHHDPHFVTRMRRAGYEVATHRLHAIHTKRGHRHVVYVAKPGPQARR